MKMTPEQKAFYEYGKARGILDGVRKEFMVADIVFGISKQASITSFRKFHPSRRRLIEAAWQKRSACRKINRPHLCDDCVHMSTDVCKDCKWEFYSIRLKTIKSLWEPRKEGE